MKLHITNSQSIDVTDVTLPFFVTFISQLHVQAALIEEKELPCPMVRLFWLQR
jgi:hypothetical protein